MDHRELTFEEVSDISATTELVAVLYIDEGQGASGTLFANLNMLAGTGDCYSNIFQG